MLISNKHDFKKLILLKVLLLTPLAALRAFRSVLCKHWDLGIEANGIDLKAIDLQ